MIVGIWGSCVTRDVFEVVPIPHVTLRYHARSSWVTQAAELHENAPVEIPAGDGFALRTVREDFDKTIVGALIESDPDLVVFDLIDERFDIVALAGSSYTLSDYYTRVGVEEPLREASEHLSQFKDEERGDLFAEAACVIAPQLIGPLPATKFVLHQAWYTARSTDPDQVFYDSAADHVAWNNRRLAHHYAALIDAFGDRLHVIEADRASCLVSDPGHRWGLAHFHYTPEYYEQIARALEAVHLGNLTCAPSAHPAVPTPAESGAQEQVQAVLPPAAVDVPRESRVRQASAGTATGRPNNEPVMGRWPAAAGGAVVRWSTGRARALVGMLRHRSP